MWLVDVMLSQPGLVLTASVLVWVGVALYLGDVVDAPPLLTDQYSYHVLGARLIADNAPAFAFATADLMTDAALNWLLRGNGRVWVEANYAWSVVYR